MTKTSWVEICVSDFGIYGAAEQVRPVHTKL